MSKGPWKKIKHRCKWCRTCRMRYHSAMYRIRKAMKESGEKSN